MNLNIPDTRQKALEARLSKGEDIVATQVAAEFGVSLDTIRRDIQTLEAAGKAQRVRGGAVPLAPVAPPLHMRLGSEKGPGPALIAAAVAYIGQAQTLLLDGGTTILALAEALPPCAGRLVITPSPWVAIACQNSGTDVHLLGGRLSAAGGVAVGDGTLERMSELAGDIAVLGACGLDAGFGLSSDDMDEARLKQALHGAAQKTLILSDQTKLDRRARYQTLSLTRIDDLITDGTPDQTQALRAGGLQVQHV